MVPADTGCEHWRPNRVLAPSQSAAGRAKRNEAKRTTTRSYRQARGEFEGTYR